MKKILVIGCGWSGASFLKDIDTNKYDVTLVSPNTNFTYTPYIVESLFFNKNIDYDVKKIKNFNYISGVVKDVNFIDNRIITNYSNIKYDYLVFAHGSSVNTFNINGVFENCVILKEGQNIKDKIENLEKNSNIVVIGCGPTGSELIGNLIDRKKFNIYAVDGLKYPLPSFNRDISNYVINTWKGNNVNLLFENFVNKVDKNSIYFKDNKINYDMVFWCGGIKISSLSNIVNEKLNNKCRFGIPVNENLMVKNSKNVFAIGDCGYNNLPPTAQVAYQEGKYLAKFFNNDFKNIGPFKFKNKGQICYIGDGKSVYQNDYFYGHGKIYGYLNNFIHIYNSINWEQSFIFIKNYIKKD